MRKLEKFGKYMLISGGANDNKRAVLKVDLAKITFASLLKLKGKMGYSARDFMYYLKRCDTDTALLQCMDYEDDVLTMIQYCKEEKTVRLLVSKTKENQDGVYSITPIKQRSIHEEVSEQGILDEDIDAYKVWLAKLPQDATIVLEAYTYLLFLVTTICIYVTCMCIS